MEVLLEPLCWPVGTGSHKLRLPSVLFVGWFGPRGLATVLFGLLVLEHEMVAQRHEIALVAMLVVVLSVYAHGLTAAPLSRAYGRMMQADPDHCEVEMGPMTAHPHRGSGRSRRDGQAPG